MHLHQIRSRDGTGTLSYLIVDATTREGLIIDPNRSDLRTIEDLLARETARLTQILDTHTHADHYSAADDLRRRHGAAVLMHENTREKWKVLAEADRRGVGAAVRANAAITVDRYLRHGDRIALGSVSGVIFHTPGHTDNHVAFLLEGNLFTGDLLLIGQAGRSDLPGGDPGAQFDSLVNVVLPLPDTTRIHPGHDYAGNSHALLGAERTANPFLHPRSRADYCAFVAEFFPPLPETVDGETTTLQCGATRVTDRETAARSLTPEDLAREMDRGSRIVLLDVRESFEFAAGAIPGAVSIPLGELPRRWAEVATDSGTTVVCICQSGARSAEATHVLNARGVPARNLAGGMSAWVRQTGVLRDRRR